MLWKELRGKGLLQPGKCAKEINFVFDNCAGQNKNRMVLRFLVILVKLGYAKLARAIFLVKGHTKNDCDRLFNLMKFDYRKLNVYTPVELMEQLNKHDQVTATAMEPSEFFDWDKMESVLMVDQVTSTKKNHVFFVQSGNSDVINKQEADGETITRQTVVRKGMNTIDWAAKIECLELTPAPGLQDIKWSELYYKWAKFIPEDRRKGFHYFNEKPPKEVTERVRNQSKAAKEARTKRSRATDSAGFGSVASKKAEV